MTSFKTATQDFLVTIMALLVSCSMFLFVFGLPWNDLGLWRQTETASAILYGVNGILVACLGGLLAFRNKAAVEALSARPIQVLLAFVFVSLCLVPFSDNPMRSLHGTMKHGAGALWYIEVAIMTLSAMIVVKSRWKPMLVGASVISMACILALYFFPNQPFGTPVGFDEWVGLAGALVVFPLVALARGRKSMIFAWVVGALILVEASILSGNRSVAMSCVAIAVLFGLSKVPGLKVLVERPSLRAALTAFIIVFGLIGAYVAGPVIEHMREQTPPPANSASVLSKNPVDHYQMEAGALGTIWSRSYMVRIVTHDILEHPMLLLTGHGWGAYETAYETHAREVPGRMFYDNLASASRSYWDSHEKSNFHSHNMPIEVLYSTGLLGLALWIAFFATLAYQSKTGLYAAIGMAVFFSFWFPINHVTMMMALLLASAIAPRSGSKRMEWLSFNLAPLAVVFTFAFLALGFMFGRLLVVERYERGFVPTAQGTQPDKCALYHFSLFPENEITTALYTLLLRRTVDSKDPGQAVYDYTTSFLAFSCMIENYQAEKPDLTSLVFSLRARAQASAYGAKSYGAMRIENENWGKDIDTLLSVAPERTEFLAPYISILGGRSPERAVGEILRYLPKLKDSDPVKDYLLFLKSQMESAPLEEQRLHLQAAADKGFGNLWKIAPEVTKKFDLK